MDGFREIKERGGLIAKRESHVADKKAKKEKAILRVAQPKLCAILEKDIKKGLKEFLGKKEIRFNMPYKLKKMNSGYKVCKKSDKSKCFSKKPLSKDKAQSQMKAILANEIFSFNEYVSLNEALKFAKDEKGRRYIHIKAPEGYDIFSIKNLVETFKDIKENKSEIWKFIKEKSHRFSPLVVLLSMLIAGINTQIYINQHPEILETNPKIVQKAADILNNNPKLLKIFQ